MPRLFTSLLMLLYFITSTGMVINVHYCSNEISSVNINSTASCCCTDSKSVDEKSDDCCKEESVQSTPLDQLLSNFSQQIHFSAQQLPPAPCLVSIDNSLNTSVTLGSYKPHGPPLPGYSIPYYKLYQRLVYYG